MKSNKAIVVIDDAETISRAAAEGVALSGLLKHHCVQCGKSLLLTPAQYDRHLQDAKMRPLAFECAACYLEHVKREQGRA